MSKKPNKLIKILAKTIIALCVGLLFFSILMNITDTHFNATPSLPIGFYQKIDAPILKGSYVAFCPEKRQVFDMALARNYITHGECENGYRPLLKRVFAMEGDMVSIQKKGVFINNRVVPNSVQLHADKVGQLLPSYRLEEYKLTYEDFLLLSDVNPRSFDARYFGLAKRNEIVTVVRPVFTWRSNGFFN